MSIVNDQLSINLVIDMKKKLFTSKIKTLLIAAVAIAIVTTVAVAVSGGMTFPENLVGTLLPPVRSGVASIDRQAVRFYNYIFSYESLEAENDALKREILDMQEDVRTAQELQRENLRLRQLLKLSDEGQKLAAIRMIRKQDMTVARAEKYIESLLTGEKPEKPRANVGAFLNSLTQSLAKIQSSGIGAVSERRETEDMIVLTITIPK